MLTVKGVMRHTLYVVQKVVKLEFSAYIVYHIFI